MSRLSSLIARLDLNEVEVMNLLQGEAGLISDLCVSAEDVAEEDFEKARYWIVSHWPALSGMDAQDALLL